MNTLPACAEFTVLAKNNPLAAEVVKAVAISGSTIREVIGCDSPDYFVALDWEAVPLELWATAKPLPGQTLFVCPIPRNDSFKQLLLTAGLIAAAVFGGLAIAKAFEVSILGGSSSAGLWTTNAALWTSSIFAGGSLEINVVMRSIER